MSNLERYERIAPFYDLLDLPFEYGRYRKIRPLLFEGLSGRLLDVGVGTGRNFQFYPPTAKVIGIDLSPAMLTRAEQRRGLAVAGAVRRAITKIWEPWVRWAYGAGFDRHTEEHVPEAGLQLVASQFVSSITARPLPQSD